MCSLPGLLRMQTIVCGGALAAALIAGIPGAAQKADPLPKWEQFDFVHNRISADQLKELSLLQLKYMRGIVFGKHGRVFEEPAIQDWLKNRPWYHSDKRYRVTALNDTERADMDAIKEAEHLKHADIMPGDLKFFRETAFSKDALGEHSAIELTIMRAEIEAIHGKTFPDMPWMQSFFAERYWYHPDRSYGPAALSAIERKNLETIAEAQKYQRKLALAPGDMGLFQLAPITPGLLHGLNLYELRLLRNEVYARRGMVFRTAWIQRHFESEPWYKRGKPGAEPSLTDTEKHNVAVIVTAEARLHDEITTTLLPKDALKDMFLEDARKLREEIYAHHGKVFKDRWTNGYFRSFKWYRPNPGFTTALLSPIEKQNVTTISAYEKQARREGVLTGA